MPDLVIIALLPSAFPIYNLEANDYKEWYGDIFDYLANGFLPANPYKSRDIRKKATPYYFDGEILYKRANDGVLLRCLTRKESLDAMKEAHEGSCGEHKGGRHLHLLLLRVGYFWPTMYRLCKVCQILSQMSDTC